MATSGIATVSNTYTPSISFSGLGSEVDFQSMIDKLVEVESFAINRMETWKQEWEDKITALTEVNSLLTDFRTSVAGLDKLSKFQAKTASSSNEAVLTATAASGAASSSHAIIVNQLAQAETSIHSGVGASDTVINSSGSAKQFDFTYNGQAVSITVANGATVTDLVNAINASGANPGVTASLLDTGAGANPYRLVLQGNTTGAAYAITIDATTTLDGTGGTLDFTGTAFTESQAAQNAQFRLDGFPAGTWMERSSNTVGDVINGVSLQFKATSATAVQVSVTDDTSQQLASIEDVVAKYNEVIAAIREQTKYDDQTGTAGILFGNYAMEIIKTKMNGIATGNGLGFADGLGVTNPDTYINLPQIGIATDFDETSPTFGQLKIDSAKLQSALQTNPQAVANFMAVYFAGKNEDTAGNVSYYSSVGGITQAGRYRIQAQTNGSQITSASIDGHPVVIAGDTITGMNGYPEAGLTVRINLAAGSYDEYVRLQLGKNGQFEEELDNLLSASAGPVNILIKNYNDIIESIDNKIALEERRVEALRSRLTRQFAALDTLLGQLNEQSQYIASHLSNTNSG